MDGQMRFEAKDLKPYAEPVVEIELAKGKVYFAVTFADDAMLNPVVETLVFVGKSRKGIFRFEDIDSYNKKGRGTRTLYECRGDSLSNIFEFEHALDVLMRCALRRRKSGR